jgi:hypothetical protein
MTMLTQTRGPFDGARYPLENQSGVRGANAAAHLATIKRFCLGALAILLGGSAVAAIMALKIAIYLPRFIHH